MTEPFEELAGLDKLIHEPARLAITSALSASDGAEFLFLQRLTGLTKGNLSAHLAKLEAAGIVRIVKRFAGKRPETWIELTDGGSRMVEDHWRRLEELRRSSRSWSR